MTSCRFSRWRNSTAILDFRGPIMGSLKSACTTSCRSSVETIALNCIVFFRKSRFYLAIQRSVAFGVILSLLFFVRLRISQRRMVRSAWNFGSGRANTRDGNEVVWGLAAPGGRKKRQMKFSLLWESMGNFCILAVFERYLSNACTVHGSTPNIICVGTMSAEVPPPPVGSIDPWGRGRGS